MGESLFPAAIRSPDLPVALDLGTRESGRDSLRWQFRDADGADDDQQQCTDILRCLNNRSAATSSSAASSTTSAAPATTNATTSAAASSATTSAQRAPPHLVVSSSAANMPTQFQEAPALADQVKAGKLPAVAERVLERADGHPADPVGGRLRRQLAQRSIPARRTRPGSRARSAMSRWCAGTWTGRTSSRTSRRSTKSRQTARSSPGTSAGDEVVGRPALRRRRLCFLVRGRAS